MGLAPTTPQSDAGWRIEPPVSLPRARGGEPGRYGGGAAPGGTTGDPAQVMRVMGGTERRMLRRGAHGELVHVRLADEHCAGGRQPADDRGVVGRHPAFEDPRRAGGGYPPGAQQVLQRHRYPGQRPGVLAGGDLAVDLGRWPAPDRSSRS